MQLEGTDFDMDGNDNVEDSPTELSLQMSASEEENTSIKKNDENNSSSGDHINKQKDEISQESNSLKDFCDAEKSNQSNPASDKIEGNISQKKLTSSSESSKSSQSSLSSQKCDSESLQENHNSRKEKKSKILSDSESESDKGKSSQKKISINSQSSETSQGYSSSLQKNQSRESHHLGKEKKNKILSDSESESDEEKTSQPKMSKNRESSLSLQKNQPQENGNSEIKLSSVLSGTDSDSDTDFKKNQHSKSSQDGEKKRVEKKRNKFLDSDSEDSDKESNKNKNRQQTVNNDSTDSLKNDLVEKKDDPDSDIKDGKKKITPKKTLNRIQGLLDSESSSEDERSERKSLTETAKQNLISSDDDVFNVEKDKKKRRSKNRRIRNYEGLEDERETSKPKKSSKSKVENHSNSNQGAKKSSKIVDLIDSDSDDDHRPLRPTEFSENEDMTALSGDEQIKKKKSKKIDDRKALSRKSKSAAMQEIQSVTQKLEREKYVSIPYHRPKQRTLEEFLNRKRMSTIVPKAASIAAKLQLYTDIVSKAAEEKEKEAEEFFESEDSVEEEEENEDHKDEDYNPDSEEKIGIENDKTEIENDKVETENDKIETTNDNMEIENDKIEIENNKIETGNDKIETKNDKIEIENDKVEIENDKMETENVKQMKDTEDVQAMEMATDIIAEVVSQENSEQTVAQTDLLESEPKNPKDLVEVNLYATTDIFKELEGMGNDDEDEEVQDNIKWTEDEFFVIDSEKFQNSAEEKLTEKECEKLISNKETNDVKIISEKEKTSVEDSQAIFLNLDPDTVPSENMVSKSDSRPRLSARQQLLLSLGNIKPRLSGSPGTMIDLSEDVTAKTGVDKLIERFTKHSVPPKKVKPVVTNKSDDVIILNDENEDPKLKRPGVKMRIFKESLMQQIASQRLEEWKKKEQEESEFNQNGKDVGADEGEEEGDILDLADEEEIEDEEESEPEDDYVIREKKRKRNMFEDDEAEVSGEEDDEVEDEEEEGRETSEEEESEGEEANKPKKLNRIIKAFEDEDDSNQSEPKAEEDEEKRKWKRVDTSADMFNSFEKEEYGPAFQQPRSSSDESSQPDDVLAKKSTDDCFAKSCTNEATTQEKNFSSFENSPMFFQKSRPTRTSADLNSWLSKQTKLFDKPVSNVVTEDELLGICSGKFVSNNSQSEISERGLSQLTDQLKGKPDTIKPKLSGLIDKTQTQGHTDSQLMAICSGEFVTPEESAISTPQVDDDTSQDIRLTFEDDSLEAPMKKNDNKNTKLELSEKSKTISRKLVEIDSSDEDDFGKRSKKKTKKVKAMIVSDDEDEDNINSDEESEIEMVENEEEETYIDYDSEENEVVVVKNLKKEATKFLDKEAELSESDWDSADEDEKGMDKLEIEEGDKEDIDEEEVRDQLGKIHMKQIMDEDQRDVRLLQEILFEEGDLHSDGAGRQRQFKWKNLDKITDSQAVKGLEGIEVDFGDEEDESELIKERIEQQKFLEQMKTKKDDDDDIDEDFNDSQLFKVGLKIAKKTVKTVSTINTTETEQTATKKPASTRESTLIMPSLLSAVLGVTSKNKSNSNPVKGSFLARGDLSRIAGIYKHEKKLVLSKQNFTFNHLSPKVANEKQKDESEKEESDSQNRKRKSGPDDTPIRSKKQKTGVGNGGKRLF